MLARKLKRKVNDSIKPRFFSNLMLLVVFAYFVAHLVMGDRGLLAYSQIKSKHEQLSAKHEMLVAQRTELENKITLIGNKSLDLDLLEQIVKEKLNYTSQHEVIYYVN